MAPQESSNIGEEGGFATVDHTADWAIVVSGSDLTQLFTYAALGMNSLLVGKLETIPQNVNKRIRLSAIDSESLLVDWLAELAFWAETERLIFGSFEFNELETHSLDVIAIGGVVPLIEKHIKAVTYHDLKIVGIDSGLKTTIVFDV